MAPSRHLARLHRHWARGHSEEGRTLQGHTREPSRPTTGPLDSRPETEERRSQKKRQPSREKRIPAEARTECEEKEMWSEHLPPRRKARMQAVEATLFPFQKTGHARASRPHQPGKRHVAKGVEGEVRGPQSPASQFPRQPR